MSSIHKQAVRGAFENFVMVNKTLVQYFKDANPALLLGYFIQEESYLERIGKLDSYGYFYCKADKIEEKFGYTRKVQDPIVRRLVEANLIQAINKRVEGSDSISCVKHFKVLHTNVFNLVNNVSIAQCEENLPADLLDIKQAIVGCCKRRGAVLVPTSEDEAILNIALIHGITGHIINENMDKKHKRLKSKRVTLKYLLTAFIPNVDAFENYLPEVIEKELLLVA